MNTLVSSFKKSPAFYYTILLVLMFEIGLCSIPALDYIDGRGSFLSYYKRNIVENRNTNFDFILFGDSRSLSIKGVKPSNKNSYSFYNLSLPAAGPRYFTYFLEKYLKYHKNPKVVIWAVDPEQFLYSKSQNFNSDPQTWSTYKHRLLKIFSPWEQWQQYKGKELFFIMKESIVYQIPSVRHREGLEKIITGLKLKDILKGQISPNIELNRNLTKLLQATNGQINLGDFFFASKFFDLKAESKKYIAHFNKKRTFDTQPLKDFLTFAQKKNIKVIVLDVPHFQGLNETLYFQQVNQKIKNLARTYKALYLQFPRTEYPIEYFSELVHYNTKGSKLLNQQFTNVVWQQIISFAEK